MRAARLTLLATLVAVPVFSVSAGTLSGKIKGVLTIDGRAAPGIEVALVNVNSGVIKSAHSGDGGAFAVTLPPGDYVAAVLGQRRLAVSRAPSRVSVRAGREAFLRLDVVEARPDAPQSSAPMSVDKLVSWALAPSGVGISVKIQSLLQPCNICDPECLCPEPNPNSTCGCGRRP